MKRWRLLVLVTACLMLPQLLLAQAKVGTAGVTFLKISPSVRAVGMGESYVAVATDASAIWHNPGALARLEKPEAVVSWIDYVAGLQYGYLGVTHPVERWSGAFALSLSYLSTDDMTETTPERPFGTGRTFTASDLAAGVSYSQMLTDKFSVGGTVKIINESLADESATGWAADVGTYYHTGWRSVRLAMEVQNFGPDMDFVDDPFPLPQNFTFGASAYVLNSGEKRWWTGADSVGTHTLLFALSWSHPNDNLEVYNFGFEYGYQNTIFLRFGKKVNGFQRYAWNDYRDRIDAGEDATGRDPFYEYPLFSKNGTFFGNGASAGAGLNLPSAGLTLDYAFTGISYLENIHRFSIGYRFKNSLL